jgi:Ran GTPase-activating protein (RanGAP) involved in mRNA processing and transport
MAPYQTKNMKKHYSSPLLQVACFLLVSLFLHNCGGSHNLPIEGEEKPSPTTTIDQKEAQEQSLTGQGLNNFNILPAELWQYIFLHLGFKEVLAARSVNTTWNELITGYREVGVVGLENKPYPTLNTQAWTRRKELNFATKRSLRVQESIYKSIVTWMGNWLWKEMNDSLDKLTPINMPSFAFYRLIANVRHLPQAFWPYLQGTQIHKINLNDNHINTQQALTLAKHLQGTQVHTLDLGNNKIGDQGAERLIKYLQETNVHTLNLRANQLGAQGAVGLAKHLQGTQIHTLNLRENQLGAQGVEELAKHLQGTQVHTLDLGNNKIGDQGAEGFAKHLQGTQVHTLDLTNNLIGVQGAKNLVKHLQGTDVHTLNLSLNPICAQGAVELARYLRGTSIHMLNLSYSYIQAQGAEGLVKHLQGTSIHTLDLGNNKIGDQGAEGLAKHLKETRVHTVDLRENQISNNMCLFLREQYPHIKWEF